MPEPAPRNDHTCTRHPAGTRTCYSRDACRCQPCTTAASNWQQHQKAGLHSRPDAARLTAHLGRLLSAGMTPESIAQAADIPDASLRNLLRGRTKTMNRGNATKVLSVRIPTEPGRGYLPSLGVARRLQALAAIGWDSPRVARELGCCPGRVETLRRGDRGRVHAAVAARVSQVYERLSMTPRVGWQANRARTIAAQRGWVPPLAWDEDPTGPHGIDNPDAKPSTPTRDRKADRDAATIAEVEHLLVCGISVRMIARQLGYDCPSSLATWLRRHERDDLANLFERKAA